jgi:high-affinity nickel-transport protein
MTFIAGVVIGLHVVGWGGIWLAAGPDHPALAGLATLAYSFGLRHAFDADHIAAIDNTTRRLITSVRKPLAAGLWFSLGHSTIVLLMTAAIALFTQTTAEALPRLHAVGQTVGTAISGAFLYVIALLNLVVLVDVWRVFRALRAGRIGVEAVDARLRTGGAVSRWCGGLFRLVERPWHLYFVGALFGLGFDTATEIGLLTMAVVAASQTTPVAAVLCLPIVFAAGMTLLDSANGVVMCRAYGWAFINPSGKVVYNLVMTGVSVLIALVIGTFELFSVLFGID